MKKHKSGCTMCGMSPSSQKASVKSAAPNTTRGHKNPEMKPVGSKPMRGGNTK